MPQQRKLGGATGKGFLPGKSGNPSGVTRRMRRLDDLIAQFREVHRREPSAADLMMARSAAALAVKLEYATRSYTAEEGTRMGNTLVKLLKRLGLDVAPPPSEPVPEPAPKDPLASLRVHLRGDP